MSHEKEKKKTVDWQKVPKASKLVQGSPWHAPFIVDILCCVSLDSFFLRQSQLFSDINRSDVRAAPNMRVNKSYV